jgi:hypothetical protein
MHEGHWYSRRGVERDILYALLLGATLSSSTAAQDYPHRWPDPATPDPAHERMAIFEGTWVPDSNRTGAPLSTTLHETCVWLTGGRRHMVCQTTYTRDGETAPRASMYVLSYREADSIYIAHHAFAAGDNLVYHGRPEGDRWILNLQPSPLLPASTRLREIITVVPEGLRYVEELSVDGGPWTITEDYRRRRIR